MNGRVFALIVGCTAVGALSGCDGGPASATVSGEVKVDGVPVADGTICFAPLDGTGAPATAEIKDGKYEVRTTAGNKRVAISVPVVTAKRKMHAGPTAALVDVTTESLPAKYHSKSELSFDVQSGGNTKDWELSVKRK